MKNASPNVENAVYVSFLEHLYFEGSPYGAEARRLLPPELSEMLVELEEHFRTGARSKDAHKILWASCAPRHLNRWEASFEIENASF